jgi:hypothetical protein
LLAEKLMEKDVEGIVNVVIARALDGNLEAAKIVLERLVPVRRGRPTPFTMPAMDAAGVAEAFAALVANVASGRLTVEEGQAVANLLDMQRKAIETSELADLVKKLAAKAGIEQ